MGQSRLAVIEDGALCELYIERPDTSNLAGNIYIGRVENVLPGMNAAFVDIGIGKNGFLCAGDIPAVARDDASLAERIGRGRIERLVRPGQELLVQVVKPQTGEKGPRLSSHITLPGRLMVIMPGMKHVGVSRKIDDGAARERLYGIGEQLSGSTGPGIILRTAAETAKEDAIASEYGYLTELWQQVQRRAEHIAAPKLIHSDADIALHTVRDMFSEEVDALWIDDAALYDRVMQLAAAHAPAWADRVRQHVGSIPLFDIYRVDAQAEKALGKFVWLKNGGSLVIEQTEALTVIDVNTGKFTGGHDPEETLFRHNCAAALEVMRQLRLRDLGGIIVVDFIDMQREEHKSALLDVLRDEARRDRNHVNVVGMTALGLVEMTRKKTRQPLCRQLMHTCSDCGGNGYVPSHETTARRIVRDLWRRRRNGETGPILVQAAEPVCGWLRTIGAPEGGGVYVCPVGKAGASDYSLSPADEAALPDGAKKLK